MAQALHSLLPGHMGPDVEVPTLRGADTHILQFSTMSKALLKDFKLHQSKKSIIKVTYTFDNFITLYAM